MAPTTPAGPATSTAGQSSLATRHELSGQFCLLSLQGHKRIDGFAVWAAPEGRICLTGPTLEGGGVRVYAEPPSCAQLLDYEIQVTDVDAPHPWTPALFWPSSAPERPCWWWQPWVARPATSSSSPSRRGSLFCCWHHPDWLEHWPSDLARTLHLGGGDPLFLQQRFIHVLHPCAPPPWRGWCLCRVRRRHHWPQWPWRMQTMLLTCMQGGMGPRLRSHTHGTLPGCAFWHPLPGARRVWMLGCCKPITTSTTTGRMMLPLDVWETVAAYDQTPSLAQVNVALRGLFRCGGVCTHFTSPGIVTSDGVWASRPW